MLEKERAITFFTYSQKEELPIAHQKYMAEAEVARSLRDTTYCLFQIGMGKNLFSLLLTGTDI